jgi:fluoroquinolone resistance protein
VLRRAKLFAATFDRCKLTGADLTDAGALDLQFTHTLLVNARLPGFSFRKQVLTAVDFSQADLGKCDFRGTMFDGCSLRDASLDGCRFDGADLRGADIGGLRLVNAGLFRGATISREQAGQLLGELGLNVR